MNLWTASSEATGQGSASCLGSSTRVPHSPVEDHDAGRGGGMMALLLGRPNSAESNDDDTRHYSYDVDFGWRPSTSSTASTSPHPATTSPSSLSAVSSFNAYPFERTALQHPLSSSSSSSSTHILQQPARDEQDLYSDRPSSAPTSSASGSPSTSPSVSTTPPASFASSLSFPLDVPYYLHLPRPSLPSFEPMMPTSGPLPSSSSPSSSSTSLPSSSSFSHYLPMTGLAEGDPSMFGRSSWPYASSSSTTASTFLPDIFRPSVLFGPSSSSSSSSLYAPAPMGVASTGDSACSSTSSSFSASPPAAWRPPSPDSSSCSSSSSSPDLSSAAAAAAAVPTTAAAHTDSTASQARTRRRSSAAEAERRPSQEARRPQEPEGQPQQKRQKVAGQPTSRKPILRRKMEEEYYHYLKQKLNRMESTRKKREQRGLELPVGLASSGALSLSSSPESSDLAYRSPEIAAPTSDELRKEEEQLYVSGTAMECFRHYHEKISSFLVVENVELSNEEWMRSVLKGVVCQATPFALKINAILAFGALVGGQRHWADIFFDKWRRLLTEFFDSSDYEVAEGLTVMSYYLFYLGDPARSRCFAESAAQISVRARPGGGLMFIRAQTIAEVIATNPGLSEAITGGSLYLKKPLLTFPPTVEEHNKVAVSSLLEQLILVSSMIHMWRTNQLIAECRERGKRARRRRRSSSADAAGSRRQSANSAGLASPLHLLSVLQAIEEKLESLELRQREPPARKGGRKGSVDAHLPVVASEQSAFMIDLLAFTRFVLYSVRADCHREAGMTKNAYISAEKILIQLEKEAGRLMKFVMALSPLVLSFVSPVIELLCGPLRAQFLTASESLRAVSLLTPLHNIFPSIMPLPLDLGPAAAVPVATATSSGAIHADN